MHRIQTGVIYAADIIMLLLVVVCGCSVWLEVCSDLGVVLCVGSDPRTEERIEWQS